MSEGRVAPLDVERQGWFDALGATVTALREERLLTPETLGERIGYSPGWVEAIEAARLTPSFFNVVELAFAFGVTAESLVGLVERRFWEKRHGRDRLEDTGTGADGGRQ